VFRAIDPRDATLISEHPFDDREAVFDRAVAAADAQRGWREQPLDTRAALLRRLAVAVRDRKDELAALMTREMGKPVTQAEGELDKCAWVAEHYAEHGPGVLADRSVAGFDPGEGVHATVVHRPLGVVLAIMPWNFPFWQVFRFGVPALLAGNGIVLKHAPNVPGCGAALPELFAAAGFPPDLVVQVRADLETTGALIDHEAIAAVTLTGSTRAGSAVAERAGRALKKTVLELGGSDAYIVLPDADPEAAAGVFVQSRLLNSGQSCISAKRLVVTRDRLAEVEAAVVRKMSEVSPANPSRRDARLGPMAREDLRDTLHRQVEESVAAGAQLLLGGEVPEQPGWWYPPTVLSGVRPGMPAYAEELFGPVAALLPADDLDDALRIANDSAYGLGGGVISSDLARAESLARDRLEVGCAFVNDFVRSDPRLPFGGIKRSGYGRELGREGMLEFVNVKTVLVRSAPGQ